ncbi:ubiquilin [Nematocida minor]|uniref:ubiquilin n=1 Tax=Nematocida minor TaxID=1912983 RepID=UPI00221F8CB8|nr:ubiquilin [Nematocida minor]KAI5190685.1 ubiquilin [Nematocida minor]
MHKVTVKYLQEVIEIEIGNEDTVETLKNKIEERINVQADGLRLTHKGGILSDTSKTMGALGIEDGAIIYANKMEKPTGPSEINGEVYHKPETHPSAAMMKDPGMKKIFSNPDIMKGLLDMLPELKNENPEIRKLMESSEMLEQMSKLAEDPEHMNTQMKNLDIAMAKLETIPGGFNMLRGMLKTQKDPSESLAEESERMHFKEGSKDAKPSSQPVPNPWGKYNFNPILEYRSQVKYMKECGFTDISSNIKLLIKHQGDVDSAITEIVSDSAMSSPLPDHKSRT